MLHRITKALGFSHKEDGEGDCSGAYITTDTTTTTTTTTSGTSDAYDRGGQLERVASVEEVPRPTSTVMRDTGTKREREDDAGANSGRARKTARGSDYVDNLTPNYNIPKNATPIPVPGQSPYNVKKDWKAEPQILGPSPQSNTIRMGGYRRGGGIQPMNRLGQQSRQAASHNSPAGFFSNYRNNPYRGQTGHFNKDPNSRLETEASRGSNVKFAYSFREDDVDDTRQGRRKKQKTGHKSAAKHPDPVDLTSHSSQDEAPSSNIIIGRTLCRTRDSTPKGAQVHTPRQPVSQENKTLNDIVTGGGVVEKVHHHTDFAAKRQRSQMKSASLSSRSKTSTPDSFQYDVRGRGTQQRPLDIDDDDDKTLITNESLQVDEKPDESCKGLPRIDLMSGMDEAGEEHLARIARRRPSPFNPYKVRQGSKNDLRAANVAMQSAAQRNRSSTEQLGMQGGLRRRILQPGDVNDVHATKYSSALSSHFATPDSSGDVPMAKRFRRDESSSYPQEGINMTSRSVLNDQSESDEDDVLSGAKTVERPLSTRSSPQKISADVNSSAMASRRGSDAPTRSSPVQNHSRVQSDAAESVDDEITRIPVRSIFCKACVLEEKDLKLVWDRGLKVFRITAMKEVMTIREATGQRKPITIGAREAGIAFWCSEKSCEAILKGSSTSTSQGQMAIQFKNKDGLLDCYNALFEASESTVKYKNIPPREMHNLFTRRAAESMELQERSKKFQKHGIKTPGPLPGEILDTTARYLVDDDIQYDEDDQAERPSKVRKRMQGGETLADAISDANFQQPRGLPGDARSRKISQYMDEPRRSTRQAKPTRRISASPEAPPLPPRWTEINKLAPWKHSLVYPAQGMRRVTVDFADLGKLDEGEFLNDNIVNFELRYIEEHMSPEHRQKVHFFNTFFYTSLTNNCTSRSINYKAVERWTKNTDIFNIPYVVVPINLHLHWFVVIICNLTTLQRKCSAFDDVAMEFGQAAGKERAALESSQNEAVDLSGDEDVDDTVQVVAPESSSGQPASRGDVFKFGADGTIAVDGEEATNAPNTPRAKKSKKKKPPAPIKHDTTTPILFSMDSFEQPRAAEIARLKQYVAQEAEAKRAIDINALKGMTARGIPAQSNFSDCGIYVCGYIAEFARDPDGFVRKVLQKEKHDQTFLEFDPSTKRDEIRSRILDLQKQQDAERDAQKKAKAATRKALSVGQLGQSKTALVNGSVEVPTSTMLAGQSSAPPSSAPQSPQKLSPEQSPSPSGGGVPLLCEKRGPSDLDENETTEELEIQIPRTVLVPQREAQEDESSFSDIIEGEQVECTNDGISLGNNTSLSQTPIPDTVGTAIDKPVGEMNSSETRETGRPAADMESETAFSFREEVGSPMDVDGPDEEDSPSRTSTPESREHSVDVHDSRTLEF